jgi:hypothetical protein
LSWTCKPLVVLVPRLNLLALAVSSVSTPSAPTSRGSTSLVQRAGRHPPLAPLVFFLLRTWVGLDQLRRHQTGSSTAAVSFQRGIEVPLDRINTVVFRRPFGASSAAT